MRPNKTFIAALLAVAAPIWWASHANSQAMAPAKPAAPVKPSRLDPADAAAPVPAATYRSAFSDFRPIGEYKVGDWRAANDEVGRIGGWKEYAREAQTPEPSTAPPSTGMPHMQPPAAPAAPKSGGHGGHGHHGMPGGKK